MRIAISAIASAATSVNMCAASDTSARLRVNPTMPAFAAA